MSFLKQNLHRGFLQPAGSRRSRAHGQAWLLAVVTAFVSSGSAKSDTGNGALRIEGVEKYPELNACIKNQSGWIGSDGAYSMKVDERTTFWTFGDTWIGTIKDNKRLSGCEMINNSAAVQKLSDNGFGKLEYKWMTKGKKASSLWIAKERKAYFWPGDGVVLDGKAFVFLHKIKPDKSKPEPFQFKTVSDYIAKIDNPLDSPALWKMTYADLKNDSEKLHFATATICDGDYVYIYVSNGKAREGLNAHPAALARISKKALQTFQLDNEIEYFTKDNVWKRTPENLATIFADAAPEMSVTRVAGIDGFIAVYMPPLSKEIMIRHAPRPEGPWSARQRIYDCPEKNDTTLLYSAKTHQELTKKPNELIVTYCRNSKEFKTHFEDAANYFPQAIRLTVKAEP